MLNDTTWSKEHGESQQPAALPYWVYKKGKSTNNFNIPSPSHPFTDAITSATPSRSAIIKSAIENIELPFRILLEINQTWDWNQYWNNNKMPGNMAYRHSAQPSVIYACTINNVNTSYYLNPIGHGSPDGSEHKLFTDLSTLTTATEIFKRIKVEIKAQK
ncbi:MAG: hypothetical protein JXR60_09510 [Bacteroidales bacterium]|nr:hypothetical protein [Bacteroidales bacterium]